VPKIKNNKIKLGKLNLLTRSSMTGGWPVGDSVFTSCLSCV
jgi:hypothetical protein